VKRYDSMGMEDKIGRWVRWADYDALLLERNSLECDLQLAIEALYFAHRAAQRYAVVRSLSADVTPEEMDRGADVIIAQREELAKVQP
jgi:hypothetical protein